MYAWGGDTNNWKGSTGYKFDPARRAYLDKLAKDASVKGPRTYNRRSAPDKMVDTRGKTIESASENPLIFAIDVTGSMSEWPAEFFDRAPLLYQTLSQYKQDLEVCFAAIGDANSDQYPLQVNDFDKGVALEDKLKALCPEGGGGGQIRESYELFGHFILNNCKTPNATSPFLFIYGDEKFYEDVNPSQVEHYIGDKLNQPESSKGVWDSLSKRFNLFFLQKPYGHGDSHVTAEVKEQWSNAIGSQRIIDIPSKERAVDIAMGIVAKHWGQFGDFKDNLSARQTDESVKNSVYVSLRHIPEDKASKSVLASRKASTKTTSLSEMYNSAKK